MQSEQRQKRLRHHGSTCRAGRDSGKAIKDSSFFCWRARLGGSKSGPDVGMPSRLARLRSGNPSPIRQPLAWRSRDPGPRTPEERGGGWGDARREKRRRRSSAGVEVRHVGNVERRLPLQAACGCLSLSERNSQPLFCFCGKSTHELKRAAGLLFIAHHRQVPKGNRKTATVHKNLGRPSSSSFCHSPRGELASH